MCKTCRRESQGFRDKKAAPPAELPSDIDQPHSRGEAACTEEKARCLAKIRKNDVVFDGALFNVDPMRRLGLGHCVLALGHRDNLLRETRLDALVMVELVGRR